MASFTDSKGRAWDVSFTILTVKNLREKFDIKITDPTELTEIFEDPVRQFDIVWAVCEAYATEKQVSAEDFSKIFTAKYEDVVTALTQALTDFFRQCGKPELAAIISKTLSVSKLQQKAVEKNLSSEKLDLVTNKQITAIGENFDHNLNKMLREQEKEEQRRKKEMEEMEQMNTKPSSDSQDSSG